MWSSIVVLILIRRYLFWFNFFLTDEMANLRICQIQWWICESSPCHTSSVWPWSDAPKVPSYGTKVPLYGTYLDGLRHCVHLAVCPKRSLAVQLCIQPMTWDQFPWASFLRDTWFNWERVQPQDAGMHLSRPNISTGEINCFYRYTILYWINIILVQYGKFLCT